MTQGEGKEEGGGFGLQDASLLIDDFSEGRGIGKYFLWRSIANVWLRHAFNDNR